MENYIRVRGARQHNLKNINLDIPKNKLVVFTGVSGSGKSSLAFDTIYAEGQRRYVESLSTYARQFLGIMEKPDVDLIEGLSPAISIDQKTTSKNPRSTVGTITEIYDYLRLLFARIGHPHCPICGREIARQSVDQIVEAVFKLVHSSDSAQERIMVLAPLVSDKKGEYSQLLDNLKTKGFTEVRIDKYIKKLNDDIYLIKTNKHSIEVVCDRLVITKKNLQKDRLTEAIDQALKLSDGLVIIAQVKDTGFSFPEYPKNFTDTLFSERFACPVDNIQIPEIEPRSFSFNSPHGACPTCTGLGIVMSIDESRIIAPDLSIKEGGIIPFANMFEYNTYYSQQLTKLAKKYDIPLNVPLSKLTDEQLNIILYEEGGFVTELTRRFGNTESDWIREEIGRYMQENICHDCLGARLKPEALAITIEGKSISGVTKLSINDSLSWVSALKNKLNPKEILIANLIINEVEQRLNFLLSVGLSYLTLARSSGTLSGGEAQRIRLASQIGSGLTGVLYVLDEPTIGLHQRDNQKLITSLKKLRDLGNTVIVVEHDREMMMDADYIFDFGPGAGSTGGEVTSHGTPSHIISDKNSLTGKYLSGKKKIIIHHKNMISEQKLSITNCRQFNLKNIDVEFPLGKLVVITGVSGSGKSSLLVETLYPALSLKLNPEYHGKIGEHDTLTGFDKLEKVILIDQSPIGKTPRSNPATYTKAFDEIREIFAQTKTARMLGFKKSRFSFNLKGGRCEACEGHGSRKIEMQFMSDIYVPCEVCAGMRYNQSTLTVTYRDKNIAQVLNLTVNEALEFFQGNFKLISILETLKQVGLDYIQIGQPATTLSGGEAQRIKLASELARRESGDTVYILDEPTTGLHFSDLEKLLSVLNTLVARGNSIFVIEHNLDVIRNADWIIDLGPGGGDAGGKIIASGTPQQVALVKSSYTGNYLKELI